MAEVLVLAEHTGGGIKKVTCELLTAAARLGEPSIVWAGPGAGEAQDSWENSARPGFTWLTPVSSTSAWWRPRRNCCTASE